MLPDEIIIVLGPVLQSTTFAPQPQYFGWPFVSIEHYRNSTIARLVKVANSLVARASEVHIPEGLFVQNPKVGSAFGRYIYVALLEHELARTMTVAFLEQS